MDALLCPEILVAAGAISVGRIGLLSKAFKAIVLDGADPALGEVSWRCACQALQREFALWCPEPVACSSGHAQSGYWQKLFFQQLWPARSKWASGWEAENSSRFDFAIQVSVRFKPGDTSCGQVLVPLHQKLMALRSTGEASNIGKKEPPEFLDALMGHVMRDAVRLPGSGRVCERSVIESQLRLHGNRDPFDGSELHVRMLEPQEELTARIQEWRLQRLEANAREDNRLDENQTLMLIKEMGGDLDPEVVEMLLEADQLKNASKRAVRDATEDKRTWNDDTEVLDVTDEEEPESAVADDGDDADVADAWWEQNGPVHVVEAESSRRRFVGDTSGVEEEIATKREGARVILVAPPTRVIMFAHGTGIRPFIFTRVFDGDARQDDVYQNAARTSVCSVLNGFNACLLCYGQTGSGKTHTMFGPGECALTAQSGCVVRALSDLLTATADLQCVCGVTTTVTAQYVQIYQDVVTCLTSGDPVALREEVVGAPVLLQGATATPVTSLQGALELLAAGEERKRYAETAMNHKSSRAHTVLVLKVSQQRGDLTTTSHIHLVDLAGSERVKKSFAQGGRLVEAVGINSSLMVLGKCIAARVEGAQHVPYYESRLTLLLRSALGGNSRTSVVVCCHKEDLHGDETLQAIRFGERCAVISNRVQAAMATSTSSALSAIDAALRECARQIQGLEGRGKGHLPACAKLRTRHEIMTRRRAELTATTAVQK